MKNPAARNPFPAQLANRKLQRGIPTPQNCPFADTFFYNDDGYLARDAFDFANVEFKIFLLEARQLSLSPAVVSNRSDVSRAQTEARTGRQCGGHLSTRLDAHFMHMSLGVMPRKNRHETDRIHRI